MLGGMPEVARMGLEVRVRVVSLEGWVRVGVVVVVVVQLRARYRC